MTDNHTVDRTNMIPPCPVCGTVPPVVEGIWVLYTCGHFYGPARHIPISAWKIEANEMLGSALRTHGIHTIQQLTERLAPDPRVAVWTELADYIESCVAPDPDELTFVLNPFDSAEARGIETGKKAVMNYIKQLIAAQRGEG